MPLYQLSEDSILSVEIGLGRVTDEELAAVRIGLGRPRHGQGTGKMFVESDLVLDVVARSAGACSGGITALRHKARNYPVECATVIVALAGQKYEVVERHRNVPGK